MLHILHGLSLHPLTLRAEHMPLASGKVGAVRRGRDSTLLRSALTMLRVALNVRQRMGDGIPEREHRRMGKRVRGQMKTGGREIGVDSEKGKMGGQEGKNNIQVCLPLGTLPACALLNMANFFCHEGKFQKHL